MCTTYNTKKAFRSLSQVMQKAIFEKLAPELEINWTKVKTRNVDHLYDRFLSLSDDLRGKVDSALYEIFVFAEHPVNATTLHSLIAQQGLIPPAEFDEWSIHDKAAWVFLQDETAWTQAARFAHIDRMTESLWFVQKLFNGGAGKVEYEDERFERLERGISEYIYNLEGRGKYCFIEYFERSALDKECFFLYLSDYPRNTMQWKGGNDFSRGIDKHAYEIVIVYDRKENHLSVRTTGPRAHKERLCQIWAETMRDTIIQDADLKKQAFDISGFKKGPDNIIVDPLSDVREAKVLMLEAGIAGNKGSRRVYEESDLDLYTQMRKELNPDRVPMSILEISCVKLRLQLDPKKYGRKQCQTVTVRPNSCNINSKDPGVQLVIMETLKSWGIVCA